MAPSGHWSGPPSGPSGPSGGGAPGLGGARSRRECERPRSKPLGRRTLLTRPMTGTYRLTPNQAGWVAPVPSSDLGRGPVQFLGVFDTAPDLEPYDDALHAALAPVESPGGVVLRWQLPRALDLASVSAVSSLAPGIQHAAGLVLYVAGVDVLPDGWRRSASWPGLPPDESGFVYTAGDLESEWAVGLSSTRPRVPSPDPLVDTDFGAGGSSSDGLRYLARHVARPALDLLAYSGAGAEADLVELAGGYRYVAAWLRLWWPAWDGADPFAAADYQIPYVINAGRAVNAGHRAAWHVAVPIVGPAIAAASRAATMATPGGCARVALCSPIAGAWYLAAASNGQAADPADGLFVGLELRSGERIELDTADVHYNEHGGVVTPAARHGGSGVVLAGYDNTAAAPIAGVAFVSVVP